MAINHTSRRARQSAAQNTTPRWLTLQAAEIYAGLSAQTLRNWSRAGSLTLHRVAPAGNRGRTLIDREELDNLIVSYASAPACKLAMNTKREGGASISR